jgi:MoxR-like ATPase
MTHPLHAVIAQTEQVILGKPRQIRLALTCLLARGHLLIEDLPGVGKTMLAHALAKTLGLQFQRIQFTSDMLPADILGVSIYQRESGEFKFHAGPIFAQMILADEVNRATPKTQSALLEAMEEHQVTSEVQRASCRFRFSSSPHRTRSTRSALSRCRNRNSTAS